MIVDPRLIRHKYLLIMRHLVRTYGQPGSGYLLIAQKELRLNYAAMLSSYPPVIISYMYMTWVIIDHSILLFSVF